MRLMFIILYWRAKGDRTANATPGLGVHTDGGFTMGSAVDTMKMSVMCFKGDGKAW